MRGFCGWHIAPLREDVELTLDGTGSGILPLPSLLVVDVTEIVEDGVTLDLDSVEWSKDGWLEKCYGRWTRKVAGVVVTIDHGYAAVPPEVEAVVQAVAQRAVDNPGSIVRTQDGPFSETYAQTGFNQSTPLALLESEKETLGPYRILPI